jgi:uncharacterized protein (DUF2267 family)
MSANGLEVFDRTLQTTHVWLGEIMAEIGAERQLAWKVLSVVLHKLRDRLPVELAAHLGAQLPLLVRGVYYDQFQPARQPSNCRGWDDFVAEVAEWLKDSRVVDPKSAIETVLRVLTRHIPEGQIENVRDALPQDIRRHWEDLELEPLAASIAANAALSDEAAPP